MFLVAFPAVAADPPASNEEQAVERIRALRQEIENLLDGLPPETRERLRRELGLPALPEATEPEAKEPAATPPAPVPTPPPPAPVPETPAEAPTVTPAAEPPPSPPRRRRRRECNTLRLFDSNGDGIVNPEDRYWRYLYLWTDRNGDQRIEERETVSPYQRKIEEIDIYLETFEKKKGIGEIRIREHLIFDIKGDGFGGSDDALLAVDATALARRNGPQILDADGKAVEGIVLFTQGMGVRDAAGQVTVFNCP